jgi:hypothetical protein
MMVVCVSFVPMEQRGEKERMGHREVLNLQSGGTGNQFSTN